MRNFKRALTAGVVALLLLPGMSNATPVEAHLAMTAGADRMLATQNPDGSFPWIVGSPGIFQNVQGISAFGYLEAYKLTLDSRYMDDGAGSGAKATRNWLDAYRTSGTGGLCQGSTIANPILPPCFLSSSNIFFLAEYAVLTLSPVDMALARTALDEAIVRFGGTPESLVDFILTARKPCCGNLGIWDVALFVKAAQDVGHTDRADRMVARLVSQTIVDPFDSTATWYEIGLAGFIMALAETDPLANGSVRDQAVAALVATQAPNGSFPVTYAGTVYTDDTKTTAYAGIALNGVGEILTALAGADFLRSMQRADGGFALYPGGPEEYAEVNSEAVWALATTALPVPNMLLAPADAARTPPVI